MSEPVSAGGRLSDDELRELARLLARYAEHDLDQFDHWRLEVPGWQAVYVEMANTPRPDISESVYTRIWPLPDHLG